MFVMEKGAELTPTLLAEFIAKHKAEVRRYNKLKRMYEGNHPILSKKKKEAYKPDNRLVVNFSKYIVDTLNGFFIGIPIKTNHPNKEVSDYLDFVDQYNNQDDNNAELSKICSIYGRGYEMLFNDETAQIGITYLEPQEAFVIYDDSILHRPMYGVRYYKNIDGIMEGSFSDVSKVQYFIQEGGLVYTEEEEHYFGDVPIIEYVENEEGIGAFEPVVTLINAYDKAISEKANDVDYFADAYLSILGAKLENEDLKELRNNRIINLSGQDAEKIIVEFLQKPDADTTQENLIERLEKLIFHIAMVANINDDNFATTSGIALKYKLQSMFNLAKTKERKFTAGMNRRYKMIAHNPISKMGENDWTEIEYKFTPNIPSNEKEEAEIAAALAGITSEKTQLSVLSVVDNVDDEITQKKKEKDEAGDEFQQRYTQGVADGLLAEKTEPTTESVGKE